MSEKTTPCDVARTRVIQAARDVRRELAVYPGVDEAMAVSTVRVRSRLHRLADAVDALDTMAAPMDTFAHHQLSPADRPSKLSPEDVDRALARGAVDAVELREQLRHTFSLGPAHRNMALD